jgi:anaerobic ribonucleoside-triphosphate reductase activating protein
MEGCCREGLLVNLIHYPVYTLGPGKRLGIWVQGCSIRCKGCMAPHTWEFDPKSAMSFEEIEQYLAGCSTRALTVSGGEPFDQPEGLLQLLTLARKHHFEDILVYTGYTYELLAQKYPHILRHVDVLVDGPFQEGLESELIWRGSANQRMVVLTENPQMVEKYRLYARKKKDRRLQIVERGTVIHIIGIPYQKDVGAMSCEGVTK